MKLNISLSNLIRRGAFSCITKENDAGLGMLADAAKRAADSSCASIDDAISFIDESNLRIASLEQTARVLSGR